MPFVELSMAVLAAISQAMQTDAAIRRDGTGELTLLLPTEKAYFHLGRLYHKLELAFAQASLSLSDCNYKPEALQLVLRTDEALLNQLAAVADLSVTDRRHLAYQNTARLPSYYS